MDAAAHRIEPGHRWRLTISTTYWPLVWPLPDQTPIALHTGESSYLSLLVRRRADDGEPTPFGPAEWAPTDLVWRNPPVRNRRVATTNGWTTITDFDESGRFEVPGGIVASITSTDTFTIRNDDPLSAGVGCLRDCRVRWAGAVVAITVESTMWAIGDRWHVVNTIRASEPDAEVFARTTEFTVDRDWA